MKSFGSNITWLAIAHTSPHKIVDQLELLDVREADFVEGLAAAREWTERNVFVTPPIGHWVLMVGVHVPMTRDFLFSVSARLVATVQGFATHRLSDAHAWGEVSGGEILRFFSYAELDVLHDEGERTRAEVELGLGRPLTGEPTAEELDAVEFAPPLPTEEDVWALAERWSINPTTLDDAECDDTGFLALLPF